MKYQIGIGIKYNIYAIPLSIFNCWCTQCKYKPTGTNAKAGRHECYLSGQFLHRAKDRELIKI